MVIRKVDRAQAIARILRIDRAVRCEAARAATGTLSVGRREERHPNATLTSDALDDKVEWVAHVHSKRGRKAVLAIRPDREMYRHVQGF